jgi:hypothetical protein
MEQRVIPICCHTCRIEPDRNRLPRDNRAYHLSMRRTPPERHGSDPSDGSIAANALLRQEPDEEEDEEEGEGNGKEDDDDDDEGDGYSE